VIWTERSFLKALDEIEQELKQTPHAFKWLGFDGTKQA
jgi:hypothetical protein